MIKLFLALLTTLAFTHAQADTQADTQADAAKVKEVLQKRSPQFEKVEKVIKSDILGLYEVVIDGQLFYTDKTGQYLIAGSIYDLKASRNLTEDRSRELFKVDFDKLPFELALKKVKGNGQRKMAYFTDPNCGYCQKLESELKKVDNVTLYLFMLTLFQGSEEKVRGVLCSENPVKAWDSLMLDQVQPPAGTCDTPTAKVTEFSKKLRVNGTPALIFADGILIPGYIPAPEIEKALNGAAGG